MRLATSSKLQVASPEPLASSYLHLIRAGFQSSNECGNHFVQFFYWLDPFGTVRNVIKFLAKEDHSFQLLEGTKAHIKKSRKIRIRTSCVTLCNVRWNRNCGSLHLRGKANLFVLRKSLCETVNLGTKKEALLPNQEFFEVRFSHVGSSRFYCLETAKPFHFLRLEACRLMLQAGGSHR